MQLKGGPDPLQRAACQQTRCCGTFDKGEPVFCRQAERIHGSQMSGRSKAVQTAPLFDYVHVPAPCACRQPERHSTSPAMTSWIGMLSGGRALDALAAPEGCHAVYACCREACHGGLSVTPVAPPPGLLAPLCLP